VVPVNGEEVWGKYIWTKGRVGEDRGSKETDRCPLTDRVSVTGEVDEVLELVNVCLYILFALEVAIGFELHEGCGSLILWAEHQHKFLCEVAPGCKAHLP
jgi:hypothetical protein